MPSLSRIAQSPVSRVLVLVVLLGCLVGIGRTPGQRVPTVPVFRKGNVILFQGDSITDGGRGHSPDPNHIFGQDYAYIIAARYGAAFPQLNLNFVNRGVSGNKVSDLLGRWQTDTLNLKPQLLSILIGVNDLNGNVSAQQYQQQYNQLLAETVKALPHVRLVLCEPFGLPVAQKKHNWPAYRAQLNQRDAIVARLAAKYHAALVPLQQVFDRACRRAPANHWLWDGVHPTAAGHELLANAWIRAVRATWPNAR